MYFFQKLRRNSSFKIAPFYVLISLTLWGLPTSGNTQALGKASLISPRNNVAVKNGRPCFEWHAAEGAEKYTVQVSSDTVFGPSSKRWVLNDVRSTRQCWKTSFRPNPTAGETPYSLYHGATYYWRIKSEREGSSWVFSDYRPFRVPSFTPSTPAELTVPANVTHNQNFFVGWTGVTDATSYQLYENNVRVFSGSSLRFQRRRPVGTYHYKVRACNASGCSRFTQSQSVTIPLGKASLISPSNNAVVNNGRPCFEWHAAEGAEKYTVQVSSDTVFGPSSKRWVLNDVRSTRQCWNASFRPNPTAGETPDSLYPEATYYWRIKSEREGSSWVFSDYRPFRVPSESSTTLIVDAGADQYKMERHKIILRANVSGADSDKVNVVWEQIQGTPVNSEQGKNSLIYEFRSSNTANNDDEELIFTVTVFDQNGNQSSDHVSVFINDKPDVTINSPANNIRLKSTDSVIIGWSNMRDSRHHIRMASAQIRHHDGSTWIYDVPWQFNVDISNLAGGFHNMGTISELGLVPNIRYRFDLRPIDDGPATGWGVYRGRYFSVNDKPIITSSTALSATVGQAIQVNLNQLTVSDDDDSVHTVGILAGANYTVDGSSFTFNESTEDGVHPVRVKVNDNTEDSDVYAIPVTVTGSSSNQRVIFIHTDLLGSPVAETDENGQPIGN